LLDRYGDLLTEKQFRILDGYYNNDLSLSEIAENEGITRQGVSDFVKRTETQLQEFEEKLGLCKTLSKLKELCEEIKNGHTKADDLISYIEKL
jgi:predicted DNA-binding protein YlxM (UPF0122 family)